MSDINALVPALKRAVAGTGDFAKLFPEATDELLVGQLEDGLGAVQLDGYLGSFVIDFDAATITPDLSQPQGALLVLYASIRMIQADIRNRKNRVHYEAKGNVFEEEQSASVLVEILKDLRETRERFLLKARTAGLATAFYMTDLAFVKELREYGFSDLDAHNYNAVV